jgi:hypothetical protein
LCQAQAKELLAKSFDPAAKGGLQFLGSLASAEERIESKGRCFAALDCFARTIRLERDVFSPTSRETGQLMGIIQFIIPEASVFSEGVDMRATPILWPILCKREGGLEPIVMNAFAVLMELFVCTGNPIECLVQQLAAVSDEFLAADAPHLFRLAAAILPLWKNPIFLAGNYLKPGANISAQMRLYFARALEACTPGDTRVGEILWMKACSTLARAERTPEILSEARACLLHSARVTPPGAPHLRNVYLRLAAVVVEFSLPDGGLCGAPLPPNFSGVELALLRELVDRAEAARAALLDVYLLRLGPSRERPGDPALTEILKRYGETGLRCAKCTKRGSRSCCSKCGTVYCGAECQAAHWRDAALPHKASCAFLAKAKKSILQLCEYQSEVAELRGDVLAALGPSWRLLPKGPGAEPELLD